MTQVVTPSKTTAISKLTAKFGEALHAANLDEDQVRIVLESKSDALMADWVASIERQCSFLVRHVSVDRSRSPKAVLEASKRRVYTNDQVASEMPRGDGEEVEVIFFKVGGYGTEPDLEQEYKRRGLKPADPYSLAAVNEADTTFADKFPNSTFWKDASGKWCHAAFGNWSGPGVSVHHHEYYFGGIWWFAGLRK